MVVIIFIIIATQPIWHFLSRTGCGATRSEFKICPLPCTHSGLISEKSAILGDDNNDHGDSKHLIIYKPIFPWSKQDHRICFPCLPPQSHAHIVYCTIFPFFSSLCMYQPLEVARYIVQGYQKKLCVSLLLSWNKKKTFSLFEFIYI